MNAQPIFKKDNDSYVETGHYYCNNCGIISTKELAEKCCLCMDCGKIKESGRRFNNRCKVCENALFEKKELERIEKADKIDSSDYTKPVFDGDRFYTSYEEWLDEVINNYDYPEAVPEYLQSSVESRGIPVIDIENLIENVTEELEIEDITLHGIDELEEALKDFHEINADLLIWHGNSNLLVKVNKREIAEIFANQLIS